MKRAKHFLFLSVLLLLIFYEGSIAQQLPQPEEFLIGAFIASSPDPVYTLYNNYQQLLDLGLNSVYQLSVKPLSGQESNLGQLTLFPYIYAANDSGTGSSEPEMNAESENVDWISYFTSAKYMKWEAEGEPLFTGTVKIKHEDEIGTFGEQYTEEFPEGNISGWRSGNDQNNIGRFLIKGPDYWQYPRYTFTNTSWNPEGIEYNAVFRMKLDSPPDVDMPVCSLFVVMTDSDRIETTLASRLVTTNMLGTDYVNISLGYDYDGFFDLNSPNQNHYAMPGSFEIQSPPGYNIGSTIEFRVQWLGNKELFVDYIEVYDQLIWNIYFKQFPNRAIDSIVTYDQEFITPEAPDFYDRLKYYYTMDEPHSLDGYEPLRRVQEILDTHGIQADLLTHWYPEWDGNRDGVPSFPVFHQLAQPKKLMFWYAPFTEVNGTPDPRDFTLYWFHNNLQQAYLVDNNFYLSAQSFGIKQNDDTYDHWMLPNISELGAETMLALAHGCKGIFYETYYTYGDPTETHVEGLVDFPTFNGDFPPRDIWYKVQHLAERLNGTLGKTLMTLNYTATDETNGFLMLRRNVHESTKASESLNYLTLSTNTEDQPINFHAGMFNRPSQTNNDYFLLTNQLTDASSAVNISIDKSTLNYTNIRFRNIESQFGFDTTFTGTITVDYDFPAGEGYLFQVAPVVLYGGRLIYNETVRANWTLYDDMIIENGATLTVTGIYNANANITVKDGGSIKTVNGGEIIFSSGKRLIIDGLATVKGTSSQKLTLDFHNRNDNTGIEVLTDGDFTASKKLMLLK